jgi:hypothetical protein
MVAHTAIQATREALERSQLVVNLGKMLAKPCLRKQAGIMMHICKLSYAKDIGRNIVVLGWPGQKI